MQAIMDLFAKDLSEPYSIYTYRYFINNWPKLCVLVLLPSSSSFPPWLLRGGGGGGGGGGSRRSMLAPTAW